MSQTTRHGKTSFRNAFIAFSAFLTAFYWLVVASYPQFFIFNPFDETWIIRQLALILSLIGWVAISTVPSVVLFMYAAGNNRGLRLLPIVATLWPLSVVVNQVLLTMGLEQSQMMATVFDGITRHNPEGLWFRRHAQENGFKAAVQWRDSGRPIPEGDEARALIREMESRAPR